MDPLFIEQTVYKNHIFALFSIEVNFQLKPLWASSKVLVFQPNTRAASQNRATLTRVNNFCIRSLDLV